MSQNVVDLSVQFAMNKTASAVLTRAAAVGSVADQLLPILSQLKHNEQRFLVAMICWRIEGGMALPASDLLSKLPSLQGLEFGSIQSVAGDLAEAGVIEVVPTAGDDPAHPTAVGFIWPALERFLIVGTENVKGPRLTGLDGAPLR